MSLLSNLKLVFITYISIIFAAFYIADDYINLKITQEAIERHTILLNYVNSFYQSKQSEEIDYFFDNARLEEISGDALKMLILDNALELRRISNENFSASTISYNNNMYLIFRQKDKGVQIYKDLYFVNHSRIVLTSIFIFLLLLTTALYINGAKSILKIRKLTQNIKNWQVSTEFVAYKGNKFDEISALHQEFSKTSQKINELLSSRQFFLRSIMHELKTPISKGLYMIELSYNEKRKMQLKSIFKRLTILLNEFAKLEQILSKNYEFKPSENDCKTMLDEAIEIMLLSDESAIIKEFKSNPVFMVDKTIFVLLLKNLLDNALKYSHSKTCKIYFCDEYFLVENDGCELKKDIGEYFKSYQRESEEISVNKGFGIGLYLIKYICDLLHFEIEYYYQDSKHHFKVIF